MRQNEKNKQTKNKNKTEQTLIKNNKTDIHVSLKLGDTCRNK